jgi:hypothetical protein
MIKRRKHAADSGPGQWVALPLVIGRDCPACGERTTRDSVPPAYRFWAWLTRDSLSYRKCYHCLNWWGLAWSPPPRSPAAGREKTRRSPN